MTGFLFHFSDEQWETISRDLRKSASFNANVCRFEVSILCGGFVHLRPHIGKDLPSPERANEAWLKISGAAKKLKLAISELREAGAADFSILGSYTIADEWAAQLPLVICSAKESARLELERRSKSNKADPYRDSLVKSLVRVWQNHTGQQKIPYTDGGPLMRFLVAITTPTLKAAADEPLTTDTLRGMLRKMANSEWN
jgi:hypothetical protein